MPRATVRSALLGVLTLALVAGCSLGSTATVGPGELTVRSATVDEPINGRNAAVRLVIDNATDTDDALVSVTSPSAGSVTLHESETDELGRSSMAGLDRVEVPARRQTTFRAGGLHVMLEDFTSPLALGDEVELTLTFAEAGARTVTAEVVEIGSQEPGTDDGDHGGDDHAGH